MTRQSASFLLAGGLNMQANPLSLQPGELSECLNVYCHKDGGYAFVKGWERFDGRLSPSGGEDAADVNSRRAAITAPPGAGPVRGVAIYNNKVLAFRNAEDNLSCVMWEASAAGWVSKKAGLAPNGTYRFVVNNFGGAAGTAKLYGVSGVHKGFSWDGTSWVEITTGMADDKPSHVTAHSNHLFFAYQGGSVQHSAVGDPLTWTILSGAAEIGIGDTITALVSQTGALIIYGRNSIHILYGTSSADWSMKTNTRHGGSLSGCAVSVGNDVLSIDDAGVAMLSATQTYGDFGSVGLTSRISALLQTLRQARFVLTSREDWTARIFCGVDTIIATMDGSKPLGYGFAQYPELTCGFSGEIDGNACLFVGGANGLVYELDKGPSADGLSIQRSMRTVFHHWGAPQQRKRVHCLALDVFTDADLELLVYPEFDSGLGSDLGIQAVQPSSTRASIDDADIDTFELDSPTATKAFRAYMSGVGVNINAVIYCDSSTASDVRFTAAHLHYSPRAQVR